MNITFFDFLCEFDIVSYLSAPDAKYVVVPIITIVLSTFVKYFCQNDKYAVLSWDLFYWGPNLMTTALLLIFIDYAVCCNSGMSPDNAKNYGNLLFVYFLLFIIMTLLIRKKGWKADGTGKVRHAHVYGVVLPDLMGFVYLYYILNVFTV